MINTTTARNPTLMLAEEIPKKQESNATSVRETSVSSSPLREHLDKIFTLRAFPQFSSRERESDRIARASRSPMDRRLSR